MADQEKSTPALNWKNYGNLLFYILNCVVTFGLGNFGWFGAATNTELSEKYQTIVTPAGTAFSIWGIIFVFQAIFVVYQLLPSVRGKPMVQEGVSYWYILTCLFQCAWTPLFGFEYITLALIAITLIWLSLVALNYQQYYVKDAEKTLLEFWLLRFPFQVHCGWLTCASVLNVNVLAVKLDLNAEYLLPIAIISLAYLHAVSVWVLFGFPKPNYTIAGVITWANWWIFNELREPKDLIKETFPELVITSVSYAALAVSIIVLSQAVVRIVLLFAGNSCAVNRAIALESGDEETAAKNDSASKDVEKGVTLSSEEEPEAFDEKSV
mmetsp:Transcript_568/g.713  ORF Transcript_568/g.713 Transcript_568/m.713 type:complete len:324 (+) Transcript_568:113-1084(+)